MKEGNTKAEISDIPFLHQHLSFKGKVSFIEIFGDILLALSRISV
jgi:hypothetical protein